MSQMFLVLLVTNVPTCRALARPLLFAGVAAIGYALIFFVRSPKAATGNEPAQGKTFHLRFALVFAITISVTLFLCAFLNQRFGNRGLFLGAALAGFADTHATAISIASLVSSAKLASQSAAFPIFLGFMTNTVKKSVLAFTLGGYRFGLKILFGLILVVLAAFLGMWFRANC